jgi:hypothetical protein
MVDNEFKPSFEEWKIRLETIEKLYEHYFKLFTHPLVKFKSWFDSLKKNNVPYVTFRDVLHSDIENSAIVIIMHFTSASDISNEEYSHNYEHRFRIFIYYLSISLFSIVAAMNVQIEAFGIDSDEKFDLFIRKFMVSVSAWNREVPPVVEFINFLQAWKSSSYPETIDPDAFNYENFVNFLVSITMVLNPDRMVERLVEVDKFDRAL